MNGELHGDDRQFNGVSTDSRSISEGELFVALSGPNFDGNTFVSHANSKGAAGAVVSSRSNAEIAQIEVDDTRVALGRLAGAWRDQHDVIVVGVTGSNGKTTLKELIAACLSSVEETLATEGNLNNDIGMPLMMSRIDQSHHFVVLEMGANHAGEIAYLTGLAKPNIVVITNAAAAHLEGFGSIEGVAHAKAEILQGEPRPSVAVLNADDEYYSYWQSLVEDIDVLSFGLDSEADIRADQIESAAGQTHFTMHLLDTTIELTLPLAGTHNVRNACAAAAVATALDVPADKIRSALESVTAVSGRLAPVPGMRGATIYDDSYNANPLSVIAAAEFLASLGGETWLVLGDMFELGEDAIRLHTDVGKSIREAGVDRLFTLGELSAHASTAFGDDARAYDALDTLLADLGPAMNDKVSILVKGSRGMRMERVVDALCEPEALRKGA
ncbi:MAG: UDP-N-acetylmuramoyl-tripeptide--D-alanyl-D-alanine ligase [Woeseiaceae bacterium]|nr:UDP-N-acetylmuramoyl-tripeptide--D-alanyl-D-alanine ligase [Woeseiaceae bacterium]NIP21217.1 UDP-N-acetylmuramoyl-tripeptide--D-alanyl-D-alanine ligase [Woeseiaceae bacterium]NIS90189.1 UDP-N-acetylmuramoyl-tripeptide--D-alanyl-D-alanine ligase [Woeseiaceae bacterium]